MGQGVEHPRAPPYGNGPLGGLSGGIDGRRGSIGRAPRTTSWTSFQRRSEVGCPEARSRLLPKRDRAGSRCRFFQCRAGADAFVLLRSQVAWWEWEVIDVLEDNLSVWNLGWNERCECWKEWAWSIWCHSCARFFEKSYALEFLFWELWRLNMAYLELKVLEYELWFSGYTS
jgi:hypothetical protein